MVSYWSNMNQACNNAFKSKNLCEISFEGILEIY